MRACFRPLGLTLLVESNCAGVIDAAAVAFGRADDGLADMTLSLDCVAGADLSLEPQYRTADACASVHFEGRTRVEIDRERSLATGVVSRDLLRNESAFRYHVLQFVVAAMLARHGMMGIHAAACVRDGRAILLRGPSGSGKTTLAWAAVRAGWQTLGDSVVWIDTRHERRCRGMTRWFHLPAEREAGPVIGVKGRERLEVDLEGTRTGCAVESAEVAAVVFVQRPDNGEGSLMRVEPEEALALWPAGASGTEAEFPGYAREVARLMEVPAYRIEAGSPAMLERLVRLHPDGAQ